MLNLICFLCLIIVLQLMVFYCRCVVHTELCQLIIEILCIPRKYAHLLLANPNLNFDLIIPLFQAILHALYQ